MPKHCGSESSSLPIGSGRDGFYICCAQDGVVGGLQPTGYPFCVTHQYTAIITREDVYGACQFLKETREVLGVSGLAEIDNLVACDTIQGIGCDNLKVQAHQRHE